MATDLIMTLPASNIGLGTPIAALSLLYLLVLLGVGAVGRRLQRHHPVSPWIFSFALSIYCTSWAFYGVTAQAAVNGWWIPPTYIGSLILFWFAFGLNRPYCYCLSPLPYNLSRRLYCHPLWAFPLIGHY